MTETKLMNSPVIHKIEVKNNQDERDNQSAWPSGTCAIVGDSMMNKSARIEDLNHYIASIIKNKPDYLILHVGTKDAKTNSSRKIVDDLLMLRTNISKKTPKL